MTFGTPSYCTSCGAQLPESAKFCPSCGFPVSSTSKPSESLHKVFAVPGKPTINAKIMVPGSIEVIRGKGAEVVVDTKVTEPEIIEFEVSQSGNIVTVKSHTKSWNPVLWGTYLFSGGPRTNVTITVPEESDLNLETSTDSISVRGVAGTIDADSKTGSVQISDSRGIINARSLTGSVNLDNLKGTLNVRATTGPIRFTGNLANGQSSFRSTAGSIDISLSGEESLAIDASTTVGQITCDLDLQDSRYERGEYVGQRIAGRVGTGAGRLVVETVVGSISIHR